MSMERHHDFNVNVVSSESLSDQSPAPSAYLTDAPGDAWQRTLPSQ